MRTERQQFLDRILVRVLLQCGEYMCQQEVLAMRMRQFAGAPRITDTEFADSLSHHDGAGRLTSVRSESAVKWKLNDTGRAWAAEQLV